MLLTRYPNGLTTNNTTALQYNSSAGDGDMDCDDMFANTLTVASSITGVGARQVHTVRMGSGAETHNITFPWNITVTDVVYGCQTAGSTAVGISLTVGSAGGALFTSTTAFSFASASGFQHTYTVNTGTAALTVGANSTGYLQLIQAAGAGTAVSYYVNIHYYLT